MPRRRFEVPHDFPDRVIRDALRQPGNLRELFFRWRPELASRLDFDHMREVPRLFLLDDYRERESDLLVEVPFLDQPDALPLLICLLVEHQSTVDNAMPLRLLLYAVLYWESQWRAWSAEHPRGQPLRLTPVLPVVLYTGGEPWDGNRTLADLFPTQETLQAFVSQWQTWLCDLNTFSVEEMVHSPAAFWQALAVVRNERAPADEYLRIIEEVARQLATLAEQERPRWDQLLKLVLYWSIYRRARGEHPNVINLVRASQSGTLFQMEVEKMAEQMELTWEEEIFLNATRRAEQAFTRKLGALLIKQLEQRFQTIPPAMREQIEAANQEKIEAALERVWEIRGPEDLTF
jgi:Putative transposase, YhgA-like